MIRGGLSPTFLTVKKMNKTLFEKIWEMMRNIIRSQLMQFATGKKLKLIHIKRPAVLNGYHDIDYLINSKKDIDASENTLPLSAFL